jgi:hypothetical protein
MALRDRVEGRESWLVAGLSVLMWLGISWLFGLPPVLTWIIAGLLFLGGVVKAGGSSSPEPPEPPGTAPPRRSIYGPEE